MTDKVFNKTISKQFEFDEEVASVFDDMLERSVPFYKEMQRLSIVFASKYLEENDRVYDLGCSTASTLIELSKYFEKNLNLIGIDSSDAMIKRASNKAKAFGVDIEFLNDDIFNEKLISTDKALAKYSIDEYYEFKKTQGYSSFEISQKREALENVLIPYTEDENKKMIKDAGFSHCETLFKWVNFATFIAIK